jgi:hypothetical protein
VAVRNKDVGEARDWGIANFSGSSLLRLEQIILDRDSTQPGDIVRYTVSTPGHEMDSVVGLDALGQSKFNHVNLFRYESGKGGYLNVLIRKGLDVRIELGDGSSPAMQTTYRRAVDYNRSARDAH